MACTVPLLLAALACIALSFTPGFTEASEATFYSPYVPSACYGYDTSKFLPGNMIAAASSDLFNNKQLCGAIYDITCKGSVASGRGCTSTPTVRVKVVDLCPGCKSTSFDLSREAFAKIADPNVGRINISFKRVQ